MNATDTEFTARKVDPKKAAERVAFEGKVANDSVRNRYIGKSVAYAIFVIVHAIMSLCPGHLIPQHNVSLHLPAIIYMELREIRLTHQNHTNCPGKNKEEYMASYESTQLYTQILNNVRFTGNKVLGHARNVRFHRTCELFSCFW